MGQQEKNKAQMQAGEQTTAQMQAEGRAATQAEAAMQAAAETQTEAQAPAQPQAPAQQPARTNASWVPLIISAVAVLAMCVFIFYMSARPADESDALSLGVVWHIVGFIVPGYDQMSPDDQLYWQHLLNHPVRKTAHFLEYAALGALVLNLLIQVKRRQLAREALARIADLGPHIKRLCAAAWAFATIYAAGDEIHQLFVPGRTGKPTDVLIDSAGILFGVFVVALVLHFIAKRQSRNA